MVCLGGENFFVKAAEVVVLFSRLNESSMEPRKWYKYRLWKSSSWENNNSLKTVLMFGEPNKSIISFFPGSLDVCAFYTCASFFLPPLSPTTITTTTEITTTTDGSKYIFGKSQRPFGAGHLNVANTGLYFVSLWGATLTCSLLCTLFICSRVTSIICTYVYLVPVVLY